MKTQTKFREYTWLVNTIRRAGKISLADLNQRWLDSELSEGVEMARTTFNRHKAAIEDMFGIIIDCDVKDNYRYYIANPEVLREDSLQNWLLSTMSVNNIVSESLGLHDRILMETAPVEGDLLKGMIEAMKRSVLVEITHCKYGSDEERHFRFAPYCIKLFKHRWYVLGYFEHEADSWFVMFSFDRIRSLRLTDEKFEMDKSFDAESHFRECYGVMVGEMPAERVVLRAYAYQQYYLRDLPLHPSQQLAGQGDGWMDFEYYLRPTTDFVGKIMNMGRYVKVLEPQHLAEEVREALRQALENYE